MRGAWVAPSSTPRATARTRRVTRGESWVARSATVPSRREWSSVRTTVSGGRGCSAHPPSGAAGASGTSVKRSAGDVDDLPGDEAGLLGDEEGDGGGDVLGLAD